MAEHLTYKLCNKPRPTQQMHNLYGIDVYTNFDCYGLFQNTTANFGRTLRGCLSNGSSDCDVMHEMIKKALSSDFKNEVVAEYNDGSADLYKDLYKSLMLMGEIKEWQYKVFGVSGYVFRGELPKKPINNNPNIKVVNIGRVVEKEIDPKADLTQVNQILEKNRDYRLYPAGGFMKVNFGQFIQEDRIR